MIHVVAIGRLARTSMPAPIMRDDAIAMVQEKHHLRVPIVRSERPAVRKHNRLSFTPVLVENLCAVLGRDRAHGLSSFSGMGNGCDLVRSRRPKRRRAGFGVKGPDCHVTGAAFRAMTGRTVNPQVPGSSPGRGAT